MAVEYPHLKERLMFYSNPTGMRWRVVYNTGTGRSRWHPGEDEEPQWHLGTMYEVEPIPVVRYQSRVEVPKPESVAPMNGFDYYVPSNTSVERWEWTGSKCDKQFLRDGLVHLRYEDAEARRQAWFVLEDE